MAARRPYRPNVARMRRRGYATCVSDTRPAVEPAGDQDFPAPTGRTPDDLAHWVALNAVRGISSGAVWALRRAFDSMERAWSASAGDLRRAGLESKVTKQFLDARGDIEPEAALAALEAWRRLEDAGQRWRTRRVGSQRAADAGDRTRATGLADR